jgi:outer membrane protein OmpA-like peptidoglycan-associated protein
MQSILDYLVKHKSATIIIYGHSDLVGTEEGCQRISEERANLVKDYFTENKITLNHIQVKAMG